MWLRLSQCLHKAPRSVQNAYFPWHTVVLHRTGKWIGPNKATLSVPVNLTKFEIRSYLTSVYGARVSHVNTFVRIPNLKRVLTGRYKGKYYRNGPIEKRAFVIAENAIPNAVKMLTSSTSLRGNPDILQQHAVAGPRGLSSRRNRTKHLPLLRNGWKHPAAKLLAPDDEILNPALQVNENDTRLWPDLTKPFRHGLTSSATATAPPRGVKLKPYTPVELRPWQQHVTALYERGTLVPPGASAGLPGNVPINPLQSDSQVRMLRPSSRGAGGRSQLSRVTGRQKAQPTRYKFS